MGPFQTIELNAPGGMSDYCARYAPFFRRLGGDPATDEVWTDANVAKVLTAWGVTATRESIADKSALRDRLLTALRAYKATQPVL